MDEERAGVLNVWIAMETIETLQADDNLVAWNIKFPPLFDTCRLNKIAQLMSRIGSRAALAMLPTSVQHKQELFRFSNDDT